MATKRTTKALAKKHSNSQMTKSEKYEIEKEKLELEKEKWNHKVGKERRGGFIAVVVGLPVFILMVVAVVFTLKALLGK